jgi:hypothetical protein
MMFALRQIGGCELQSSLSSTQRRFPSRHREINRRPPKDPRGATQQHLSNLPVTAQLDLHNYNITSNALQFLSAPKLPNMLPLVTMIGFLLGRCWLNLLLLWIAIRGGHLVWALLAVLGNEILDTFCLVLEAILLKIAIMLQVFVWLVLWIDRSIMSLEDMDRVTLSIWIAFVLVAGTALIFKHALGDWDARPAFSPHDI